MTKKGGNRPYASRRIAKAHTGRINLYAIVPFPHLFMDRAGHVWSTARGGLRQRKFSKFNGLLTLRVSWRGYDSNVLAASLALLAKGHDWRVHWDGTQICPDWIMDEAESIVGEGPTPKVVEHAPPT